MKQKIFEFIQNTINRKIDFSVLIPENPEFGNYATNIALRLAGVLKTTPIDLARTLAEKIKQKDSQGFFERVEVAPPGFINFWLSKKTYHKELEKILAKKEKYGNSNIGKGLSVQVEFISANPTGPLTLANGRGGFLGDALSRILKASGFRVEKEYYINDTGNQILTLGKSVLAACGLVPEEDDFYKGDYLKSWRDKRGSTLKKYQNDAMKLGQLAAGDFLADIKNVLAKKAGIVFDRWTSEKKHIRDKSFAKKALAIFKRSGALVKKDGALWLKTTDFGDDKDRVVVTRAGEATYFLADAGHYLETKKRGFDKKIIILGPDHYGYQARIQAAARLINLKDSEVIITQAVRLTKGGREAKMSKRKGEFITFDELIDEVGIDAARFFFLMYSPETHIDFDIELAKERSVKNPVYYVQYAYVRAINILEKSAIDFEKVSKKEKPKLELLTRGPEINLIKELIKLPDIISETAYDRRVNIIARYATETARSFHNFYEQERVIVKDKDLFMARLSLVYGTKYVLGSILDLMGIAKPDRM